MEMKKSGPATRIRCRMTRRTRAGTYCLQELKLKLFHRFCKHTWEFWPGIDEMILQQKEINKCKRIIKLKETDDTMDALK